MSTGLKNAETILADVLDNVQFAVNEQCNTATKTCPLYEALLDKNKPVFHIEYVDSHTTDENGNVVLGSNDQALAGLSSDQIKAKLCLETISTKSGKDISAVDKSKWSTMIKTLDLGGWIMYCDGSQYTTTVSSSDGRGSRRHGSHNGIISKFVVDESSATE